MSAFTISISTNTITIGDGTLNLKNVDMPILNSVPSATTQWVQDIFFSFYTQTGTPPYTYTPFDISAFAFTPHDYGMMLATLFPNLYSNTNYNTIQTEYPEFGPSFARLRGTNIRTLPSYDLEKAFKDDSFLPSPASVTNAQGWVFTDFGIGTKVLNPQMVTLANIGMSAIHLTSHNPTNGEKQQGLYDAVSSNLPTTYIVYTNLYTTAFSNKAFTMINPFQNFAVWPLFARISLTNYPTKNPIGYFNTLSDTFWMQRGTSTFFDRSARKDATYGHTGNYLLSVFSHNKATGDPLGWNIPIVPVFASLFEYSVIKYLIANYSSVTPSVTDINIGCLYNAGYSLGVGGTKILSGNVKAVADAKVYRRLMMFYCIAIERGISEGSSFGQDFITNTEQQILLYNPTFPNVSSFYQNGANFLKPGEYAYFFKYMSGVPYNGSNMFATFVAPYISWAANVLNLPHTLALNKYYGKGQLEILDGSLLQTLVTTINTSLGVTSMGGAEVQNMENYSYPP